MSQLILNYPIKRFVNNVRIDLNLPNNTSRWLVWSYCGFKKNVKANSQPNVLVAFREIKEGNLLSDIVIREVALTLLGKMRIGTIWSDGLCNSIVVYPKQYFSVNFSQSGWRFSSFLSPNQRRINSPYPNEIYPLKYPRDQNWYIEFLLDTGGVLVISCLEFFYRCFGRSGEVKRIIATYPWDVALRRIIGDLGDSNEKLNAWKVKLGKNLVNQDAIFAAHIKYDKVAADAAKWTYSQIEANYNNDRPIFVKVRPWFEGDAKLCAYGVPFDDGKSFLVTSIKGGSDPIGVPIERDRMNSNRAKRTPDSASSAWKGAIQTVIKEYPDIISVTNDEEPDHSGARVTVMDSRYEVFGFQRKVIDSLKGDAKSSSHGSSHGEDVDSFSGGEPYSDSKGVGDIKTQAEEDDKSVTTEMESKGILRDIWNAAIHLYDKEPEYMNCLDCYTFEKGFTQGAEPSLIGLEPFFGIAVEKDIKNWIYINRLGRVVRGILVIRMVIEGERYFIIEIQRRLHQSREMSKNASKFKEQRYKGFIFQLDAISLQDERLKLNKWLKLFLDKIRFEKGVVSNLSDIWPERASTFSHKPTKSDDVLGVSILKNAVKKLSG
ncbi:hypothetical protein [Marinomonas sp.]|uniref:hypothetical protein n=1 Tax=Marinomonas sp. TaxID=1904862 RepID=UPI003A90EF78